MTGQIKLPSKLHAIPCPPGLHVVATPIGNLADISVRALSILQQVDMVACEDTRVSKKLLGYYGIRTPLLAYHDHNAEKVRPKLVQQLKEGQAIALISDAGTPLISDPGYKLIAALAEEAIPVFTVPGASSVTAALSIAGLPTDQFVFLGFLPAKEGAAKKHLQPYIALPATLVLFESAKRLSKTLALLHTLCGDRQIAIARELTKKYEEVRRGRISELLQTLDDHLKGELVVLLAPASARTTDDIDIADLLKTMLAAHSLKDAVAEVSELTGTPKKTIYAQALALQDKPQD